MLRRYKCHKVVAAAKILDAKVPTVIGPDSSITLLLDVEGEDNTMTVTGAWWHRHEPEIGGYFVSYLDGYESFSPADAFEDGYTLVE